MNTVIDLVEQGYVPDWVTRIGIRRLLRQRLAKETVKFRQQNAIEDFISQMQASPLAINTMDANQQHYEVPTAFYEYALGKHKKYSCAYFKPNVNNLSTAEEDMFAITCERAEICDGAQILELGCGWGSLTLWLGQMYPDSQITAVSNSATQKTYIDETALARGLSNIKVITCDMNDFSIDQQFDRVVSIEMFEHMRNYPMLFQRITGWLKAEGKLFFHIFCHKNIPYFFETEGKTDWMAEHFFTGGLMPSYDLPLSIPSDLTLLNRWTVNGTHYARTSRAWLERIDTSKQQVLEVFTNSADPTAEVVQFNRWRMFFMACEELFAYNQGKEWHIGHYLFGNKN